MEELLNKQINNKRKIHTIVKPRYDNMWSDLDYTIVGMNTTVSIQQPT